ncbi:MAG: nitrate reductase gamma subunit [Planctomycetota bacterium]|jgi:nitrate reductase gamma subunit
MSDLLWFAVLPYVAMVLFLVVTIVRYRMRSFSYSSLSSQFLENEQHFWGSVPFHYGILAVLAGHVAAFICPSAILGWNASPVRLVALEITGLAMAILTFVGLANIVIRRLRFTKVRRVTTPGDWFIYGGLLVQVLTGIGVAIQCGWGSSWFATSVTPWLWSLLTLNPEVTVMAAMPLMVKLHVINAFLIIAVFPFTRLVHILVVPNMYLWRKTQVVVWNWDRKTIRKTK